MIWLFDAQTFVTEVRRALSILRWFFTRSFLERELSLLISSAHDINQTDKACNGFRTVHLVFNQKR
jgi:hypothetical protein